MYKCRREHFVQWLTFVKVRGFWREIGCTEGFMRTAKLRTVPRRLILDTSYGTHEITYGRCLAIDGRYFYLQDDFLNFYLRKLCQHYGKIYVTFE